MPGVYAMRRILFVAIAVVFAFTLPGAATMGAGEEPYGVAYRVDLTFPAGGRIAVSIETEAPVSPLVLEMDGSYGEGTAPDMVSHITDEAAADASGAPLAVRRDGAAWFVEGSGRITFSYQVDLEGYRAGTDYLASLAHRGTTWPLFPLLDEDLAYLPARAVLLRPRGGEGPPSLELELPEGWRAALPWADQPASLDELFSNPILAGELATQETESLLVALPSSSAAASGDGAAEYAAKAGNLLAAVEDTLGGLSQPGNGKLLVILLLRGEAGAEEASLYPSAPFSRCAVIAAAASTDILSDAVIEATAEGLAGIWLAAGLLTAPEAMWLRYGAASYLGDLVPYQAGMWGAQAFWDRFHRGYQAYREARGRLQASLAEAGTLSAADGDAAVLLGYGGAAACAAIDSELRSLQAGTGDLSALLRDLAAAADGAPLTNDDIRGLLESSSGRDWAAFFRDYVQGGQEIPASAFSSLNIAPPEGSAASGEIPREPASTSDWIILAIAVLVVFAIPFVLEPYTLNPRKPGFLKRKLEESEEE